MDYTLRQQHILVLLNDLKLLSDDLGHVPLAENRDAIDLLQHHVAQFRPTKAQMIVGEIKGFIFRCDGLLNGLPGILSVASTVYAGVKIIFTFAAKQGDAIQEIVKTFEDIYLSLPTICSYAHGQRNNMEDLSLPENRALLAAFEAVLQFILDLVAYLGTEPGHGVMKRLLKPINKVFKAPNFVEQVRCTREDMLHSFQLAHYAECAKQFKENHRGHGNKRHSSALNKLHCIAYESCLLSKLDSIKAYPDACSWTRSHEDVLGWLKCDERKSRLLILGTPGTGKSTLAGYLIDHVSRCIQETKSDEVLLYYFCGFSANSDPSTHSMERSSSKTILMTLLRQILASYPTYRDVEDEVIQGVLSYNRNMVPDHLLQKWIVSLLSSFGRVSIIIDALDECERSAFRPGGFIEWLLHKMPASRMIILGREEPAVLHALPRWPTIKLGSDGTTQNDLAMYARYIVLKVMRGDPDDEGMKTDAVDSRMSAEETDLVQFLIKRADNMFFYLFLVLHCRQRSPYLTHDARSQSLRSTPKDIFGMFSLYIMMRIADNEASLYHAAVVTLQFLIFSPEPLTWRLLLDAIMRYVPNQALQLSNVKSFVRLAVGVLFNVQELVTGQEHLVPVHYTLREYFHGTYTFDERIVPQSTDPQVVSRYKDLYKSVSHQSHHFLFRACCDSLRISEFQTSIYIYQKCADVQRQSLDGTSTRCVPDDRINLSEHASLIQRGLIHVRRLQSQLFQDQSFDLYDIMHLNWLDRQWAALDSDRIWREEKERSIDVFLATPGLSLSREELQRQRYRLKIMQEEWDKGRKGLSESSTYPLCSYALHNIFYHFHWVQSQVSGDSSLPADFNLLLNTILRYLNVALSGMAQDIVVGSRDESDPARHHLAAMMRQMSTVIRFLEELCSILAQLYQSPISNLPGRFLARLLLLHLRYREVPQFVRPAEIWNSAFAECLGRSAVRKTRKDLVLNHLLTVILNDLSYAERICLEELKTCVGIGYLIFMIRHVRQMVSHHFLLSYYSNSVIDEFQKASLPEFLDQERGFIDMKILREVMLDDASLLRLSQRQPEHDDFLGGTPHDGFLLWDNKFAKAHPAGMILAASLSGIFGFFTSSHISIVVILTVVLRILQPRPRQAHHVWSLLASVPPFALLGWLVSFTWNSLLQVKIVASVILLLISLQACGQVRFSVRRSNDEMHRFTGPIRSNTASNFTITVGSSPYSGILAAFLGLVCLLGGNVMHAADVVATVYAAVAVALQLADPDGKERMLNNLRRIGNKYRQNSESITHPLIESSDIGKS